MITALPSSAIIVYETMWQLCKEAFYGLRRCFIPLDEDLRRICEDTGSVEEMQDLLDAHPRLDVGTYHFSLTRREGYTPLTLAARSAIIQI